MYPLEAAIWAVFGLIGALFVYKPVLGYLRCSSWKETEGSIISTSIYEDTAGDETRYRPQVAYWYSVAGQPRRGDQITFGSPDQSSVEKAKKLLARYEGKETVKVFYNPAKTGASRARAGIGVCDVDGLGPGGGRSSRRGVCSVQRHRRGILSAAFP
jgi:hypothetical protein